MASPQVFNATTKSYCIVTGASRGIGRAIAIALSKKLSPGSVLVVTDKEDLTETQRLIQAESPGVQVKLVTGDLADQETFPRLLSELTKDVNPSDFQHSLLINNAGTVGDLSRFVRELDASDLKYLQEYYMINLTSAVLLTAHYLKTFPNADGCRRTVVNISSSAAVHPQPCFAEYSMGKAAREMFFKTVDREEPDIRILNYAPGVVQTEMLQYAQQNAANSGLRQTLEELELGKKFVTPDQTASVLVKVLEEDNYEPGGHVDYFTIARNARV